VENDLGHYVGSHTNSTQAFRVPKEGFHGDSIEELFWFPKEPFREQFLTDPFFKK